MGDKRSTLASVMLARVSARVPARDDGEPVPHKREAADDILFAKGAATAAGFTPLHRTYDRPPQREPTFDVSKAAAPRNVEPFQAAVVAFGCIALLLSAG
ncbi:MAG TPA: hypothetical protein VFA22_01010, partial [Stellaceae bacterium]|nr:hypothetical protein [Stellaceae bacterium]